MNLFTLLGMVCLIIAELYMPWRQRWALLHRTFPEIYQARRAGQLPRRPAWSSAVAMLGLGLLVLGFWRLWAGA